MSLDVTPSFPSVTADAVLNALPHPVIMVSADGKITDANVAAENSTVRSCEFAAYIGCRIG